MRTPWIWAAGALAVASAATLAMMSGSASLPVTPVGADSAHLVALHRRASEAAQNRRVLIIHHEPGKTPEGRILESGHASSGWELFAPAPPDAAAFHAMADRLASLAAEEWAARGRFTPDTLWGLVYFDVALFAVENGSEAVRLEVNESDGELRRRPGVPGAAIRVAAPAWHVVGEPELEDPADVTLYARGLRKGTALFKELDDGLWELAMTVTAHADAEYLFAVPAAGARVTVNGVAAAALPSTGPFLKIGLPEGESRVRIRFREDGGRGWAAIIAAAALVAGLLLVIRGLRVDPAEQAEEPEEPAS